MSMGKVYIVGAGCGDYDLITLRGVECLKKCDTVVYDSLVDRIMHCLNIQRTQQKKSVQESVQVCIVKSRAL